MADDLQNTTDGALADQASKYTVVARRYRPRTFEELVGQDTVAQGLLRAIETHRVGHAYLFTGARGVGKTSTARIFAKALNASADGKGHFDPKSEIALAIDSGDDMDVIEIDGASNRGIDEIRQLRSNASIRPTRSPYKIYIIDEVHMLTPQAFNALLKTLEEPPGHVKFIFCTTDPDKIPITVLSRCQRYDFPPVHTDQILTRLKFICANEGTLADEDALKLIARRAAGSMRDSQSLLEQMLSFGGKHITVDEVHAMLGTADESRLALFAECMVRRDAARAITELNSAIADGVDPGQLAEQFLGYLRDVMTVAIGAPAELVRTADPSNASDLKAYGNAWGLSTLLSAIQLLDESIVKMKHSVQSRILLEVALVQICTLADLQSIADIAQGIAQNLNPSAVPKRVELPTVQAPSEKKNVEQVPAAIAPVAILPVAAEVTESTEVAEVAESSDVKKKELQNLNPSQETSETVEPLQQLALVALELEGLARQLASLALDVVEHPEGRWKVSLAKEAEWTFSKFTSPENLRKLTDGLMRLTGRQIELDFVVTDEPMPQQQGVHDHGPKPMQGVSQPQRIREMMATDLIRRFIEVLGGEVVKVED